jgi:hypothetical protein
MGSSMPGKKALSSGRNISVADEKLVRNLLSFFFAFI